MKTFSGYTQKTAESLQLDAGAFFINYEVEKDTFESAVAAGKLLGATRDGGEFSAKPSIRQIQVDGVKGRAKGLETLDSWEVYLSATVLELTENALKNALTATAQTESDVETHSVIAARNNIELSDYYENVTWVGTISGSDEPIIVQVYNALNTDGISLTVKDASEGSIKMTFYGHYSQGDLNTPPFKIYYPKNSSQSTGQTE